MAVAHKVVSACFRVFEFGCACIILGVLGKFFAVLNIGNGPDDARLVYAMVMAALSIIFSVCLLPPVKYSFVCFPLDFALFICWIVCFALLEDLSGTQTCKSAWFNNYWAYYWNRLWVVGPAGTVVVTGVGCSQWRVLLGFSFIVSFCWLTNGFLGLYACIQYHKFGPRLLSVTRKLMWWRKPRGEVSHDVESEPK